MIDHLAQVRETAKAFARREIGFCQDDRKALKALAEKVREIGFFELVGAEEKSVVFCGYAAFIEEISRSCAGLGLLLSNHLACMGPLLETEEEKGKALFSKSQAKKEFFATSLSFPLPGFPSKEVRKSVPSLLGADWASWVMISLPQEEGESLFYLPKESQSLFFAPEKKRLGLSCIPIRDLFFEESAFSNGIALPRTENGSGIADAFFASVGLGLAKEAFSLALDYAENRYQGGQQIVEHDAVKLMLAEIFLHIEALTAMLERALTKQSPASLSTAFAAEACEKVCLDAVQIHGGYGYMKDFKVEKLLRDAKTYKAFLSPRRRKLESLEAMRKQSTKGGFL